MVLDGIVGMHYRQFVVERVVTLEVGDIFLPRSDASTLHIPGAR